jgi:protoheme IX farnesyltransferase
MTTTSVTYSSFAEKKTSLISDLFSLTKPRLSSLVILTCALGLFLAPLPVGIFTAFISMICTTCLVGGACVINCVMEKDIDGLMERTKDRPLPSGRLSTKLALSFGLFLVITSLILIYSFVNPLTGHLGLVATIFYVFLYTPLKQKTSFALFVGAVPGAIPPLMGWTTVMNEINSLGLALFLILFIWQLPHFLSISIYHVNDYNNANIKTYPGNLGVRNTVHLIVFYTLVLFLISLVPYFQGDTSDMYRNLIFILGGSYFVFSLTGYLKKENSPELLLWARRYFYGSLVYLPCVFVMLIFFK